MNGGAGLGFFGKLLWSIAAGLAVIVVSLLGAWGVAERQERHDGVAEVKAIERRVDGLEANYAELRAELRHINSKLDLLLEQRGRK